MDEPIIHSRGLLGSETKRVPPHAQQQQQGSQLSIDELGAAMRLTSGEPVPEPTRGILQRMLSTAESIVDVYAPDAESFVRSEALIRFCAYLFDSSPVRKQPSNGFVLSGARALLARYR